MSTKTIRLVNMTSTEVYKLQVKSIFDKIRHENTGNTDVSFIPTHLGGIDGQREIIQDKNIMRQIEVDGR